MKSITYKNYIIESDPELKLFQVRPVKDTPNQGYQWFNTVQEAKQWIDNMEVFGWVEVDHRQIQTIPSTLNLLIILTDSGNLMKIRK